MNDLLILAGYLVAYALVHSLLATDRVKQPIDGCCPRLSRYYRLAYSLLSIALLYPLQSLLAGSDILYRIDGPPGLLLRVIQICAAAGFLYAANAFDLGDFLGYRIRKKSSGDDQLSVDGAFRICRHPLYLFVSVFLVAQPIVTEAYAVFTLWTVLYFWTGSWIEERRLIDRFGATYLDYRARTPHFLPLPRK